MIYNGEVVESDISVSEKFIAVVWAQDQIDGPRSVVDIRTGNKQASLKRWVNQTIKALSVTPA